MYIITSKTKSKARRSPTYRKQINNENALILKERGIDNIIPLKNRTVEQIQEELLTQGDFAKDRMQRRTEIDANKKKLKQKAKVKPIEETIKKHKIEIEKEQKRLCVNRTLTIYK